MRKLILGSDSWILNSERAGMEMEEIRRARI
jgi:hypothetical protein